MTRLTPKQEGFCQNYIETGNASEAYRLNYNAQNMNLPLRSRQINSDGFLCGNISPLGALGGGSGWDLRIRPSGGFWKSEILPPFEK